MKYFAAIIKSVDGMVEKRAPYRQEHLERLQRLLAEGKLYAAGAWAENADGALIVFMAEDKEEVVKMIEEDAYFKAGLWPEYTVREWNLVVK